MTINSQTTKDIIKSLNLLAEKDFVVVSTDFETGQVVAFLPGFEPKMEPEKVDPNAPDPKWNLTAVEMNFLRQKNKIEAIKVYRERTGLSLADAKAICDRFAAALDRGEAT